MGAKKRGKKKGGALEKAACYWSRGVRRGSGGGIEDTQMHGVRIPFKGSLYGFVLWELVIGQVDYDSVD